MSGIPLAPARSLLAALSLAELGRVARRAGIAPARTRARLTQDLAGRLTIDQLVERIHGLWPGSRPVAERLDQLPPAHGAAVIQADSRTRGGLLLLELGGACRTVRLASAPLFLENRWPVFGSDARAASVRAGAGRAPGSGRPFVLDEGAYQLRNGRLRMELRRSGPVSFLIAFLRRVPGARAEGQYLFEPIA
jgi:hypothetical protein